MSEIYLKTCREYEAEFVAYDDGVLHPVKPAPDYVWECPACKHQMTSREYGFVKFDTECPACGGSRVSHFHMKRR
jgi:uncharacterized CHY-type Zn-finger protein